MTIDPSLLERFRARNPRSRVCPPASKPGSARRFVPGARCSVNEETSEYSDASRAPFQHMSFQLYVTPGESPLPQ